MQKSELWTKSKWAVCFKLNQVDLITKVCGLQLMTTLFLVFMGIVPKFFFKQICCHLLQLIKSDLNFFTSDCLRGLSMNIWAPSSKHLLEHGVNSSLLNKMWNKLNFKIKVMYYLVIRVGMFSDDIITTGTSFMIDDSCFQVTQIFTELQAITRS